jgi:hypothetical protein
VAIKQKLVKAIGLANLDYANEEFEIVSREEIFSRTLLAASSLDDQYVHPH